MTADDKASMKTHMSLIEDEDVEVTLNGRSAFYRVRVWMKGNTPSVALVSPTEDGPPVSWARNRLANKVWRTFLGYAKEFFYYETADVNGTVVLLECNMEFVGSRLRPTIHDVWSVKVSWNDIDSLVGSPVDR